MSSITEAGLPDPWEVRHSKSKNLPYYFHPESQQSSWEPPEGTDAEKLKVYMANYHNNRAASESVPARPQQIRVAHLLVKHEGSRRASSWREAKITRTKDEANGIVRGFERQIRSGETRLGDLAVTHSDCSSARKHGDLGFFGKGDMQKEFEDAAFKLQPGEISSVVETASGLHLIERLE